MPVLTIDEAIQQAPGIIASASYGGVISIYAQMGLWNTGIFQTIFPSSGDSDASQRRITDWYLTSLQARAAIEGPAAGDSELVGTSATIDAVVRVLCAVRDTVAAGLQPTAKRTAVIALFNSVWP